MLSVLSYGSAKAQSEDRYSNAIKKEITQVNPGPTLVEIKDGDVTVNGEVVANITDKSNCLRLKINTECAKPKPKPMATCDPCKRWRTCGSRCGGVDRYTYYRSDDGRTDYRPRNYESFRSGSFGGYYHERSGSCCKHEKSTSSCCCRHHHDW